MATFNPWVRLHRCRAPGCTSKTPVTRLMCHGHWFQLPAELRNRINGTWRRDDAAYRLAVLHALRFLRAKGSST